MAKALIPQKIVDDLVAATIRIFLEKAAEQGWRMVPERATPELRSAGVAWCGNPKTYEAMLADAPEFELDK